MMFIETVSDAKSALSKLIQTVLDGEEVIIGRMGKPVVKLVKYRPVPVKRRPGALRGKIKMGKDFDTLPEDIAAPFGL